MRKLLLLSFCLFNMATTSAQRAGFWQQKVHYKMDIDVDDQTYQYQGKMTLDYTNNSNQALPKVYFHLYFNAFQPGSMMDYRLSHIADPDPRMTTNLGTKEQPRYQSRIATLTPEQIGYQQVETLTVNGQPTQFKVDGTLLEVVLRRP